MTSDAPRLAPWIRTLPLEAQIVVTGATWLLADTKECNPGAFDELDDAALRETTDPRETRRIAEGYATRFADAPGVDGRRVRNLCAHIAETIGQHLD